MAPRTLEAFPLQNIGHGARHRAYEVEISGTVRASSEQLDRRAAYQHRHLPLWEKALKPGGERRRSIGPLRKGEDFLQVHNKYIVHRAGDQSCRLRILKNTDIVTSDRRLAAYSERCTARPAIVSIDRESTDH